MILFHYDLKVPLRLSFLRVLIVDPRVREFRVAGGVMLRYSTLLQRLAEIRIDRVHYGEELFGVAPHLMSLFSHIF